MAVFVEQVNRGMEALRRTQEAAMEFLDKRTPRERQMIGIMTVAIGLWLAYWIVVGLILHPIRDTQRAIEDRRVQLGQMLTMQSKYRRIQSQVAELEQRIRAGQQGNVLSSLETMASEAQIKDRITSMDPRSTPPNDLYKETVIEVRLANVNLKQLVDYLYRIQSSPVLLKVKRLRAKTRRDDPGYLDVNFRVSSFEPLRPGAARSAGPALHSPGEANP
jgi:type II secretory pathway component PulM